MNPKYTPPPLDLLNITEEDKLEAFLNSPAIERSIDTIDEIINVVDSIKGSDTTLYKCQFDDEPSHYDINKIIAAGDFMAFNMDRHMINISYLEDNLIGIEVPNKHLTKITLKDMLESKEFKEAKGLYIALGQDINGRPIYANLENIPNLLIRGKQQLKIFFSILLSLIYRFSPDECRFVIDFDFNTLSLRNIELNDLPHLLTPMIYSYEWIIGELLLEIHKRQDLMNSLKAENIEDYNQKVKEQKDENLKPIPYTL